jgi:hypothetical protein
MRERIEPVGIPSVHGGEDVKNGRVIAMDAKLFSSTKRHEAVDTRRYSLQTARETRLRSGISENNTSRRPGSDLCRRWARLSGLD